MAAENGTDRPDELIAALLRERGPRVVEDPALCKGLLSDAFGARGRGSRRQVQLLVAAVDAGVGSHFSQDAGSSPPDRQAVISRMTRRPDITLTEATWAVDTWYAAQARVAGQRLTTGARPPRSTVDGPPPRPTSPPTPPAGPPVRTRRRKGWVIAALVALPIILGGGVAVAIIASQSEEDTYYSPYSNDYYYPDTTVATTPASKSYKVVNTCELGPQCAVTVYSGPGLGYSESGAVSEGAYVSVVCQTTGTSIQPKDWRQPATSVWNKLSDGRWLTDAYLLTGYSGFSPELPRCP